MRLLVAHPQVAFRDCGHCLKFDYDEETGKPQQWRGQDMPRTPGKKFAAPCRSGKGCAKGTPEEPKTLSDRNWRAYLFHQQCKAVGRWPDDPIVLANAATIAPIVEAQEKIENQRLLLQLARRR